ncbi:MAG: threonine synthase [Acidobacteria bacterium]|nr:threonine synthase [Acidobacteriota bacterium]
MSMWMSLRDPSLRAPFREAVLSNFAPDGNLWMPAEVAPWPDVKALLALPWRARNQVILGRLLGEDLPREWARALDLYLPLAAVEKGRWAFELWHGPTFAFKDVGARFLAACLESYAEGPRMVLTATSGDTGAAVAAACHGRPGLQVAVLYPEGRVSPLQARQLALGGNVRAYAVAGDFDACQSLVKACFRDGELSSELGLVSANSINPARWLPQSLYFFELVHRLLRAGEARPPLIAVPSGNFGNLAAGLLARRWGLPVAGFVAATNANRTVPDFLSSGRYEARPSLPTLSSAMDVGDPSNWPRAQALLGPGDPPLQAGWASESETATELGRLWGGGYAADPHSAVASAVLRRFGGREVPAVFLATAHPAKFQESLEPVLGRAINRPPRLEEVARRPLEVRPLAADLEVLKAELRSLAALAIGA